MQAPENLIKAVERIQPRAVLLLDTNTIMDVPRLDSYEISAEGRFLLVIPQVSYNELVGLSKVTGDNQKRQKASHALNILDRALERGNAHVGIELEGSRWMIMVKTPAPPDSPSIEEKQVERNLGKPDSALLRLARACAAHLPYFPSTLITRDRNLSRVALTLGLSAFALASLRSAEVMTKLLGDVRVSETPTIDDFGDMLNVDEEQSIKATMMLEELRSEAELLIARGSGRLTYDGEQFWFRWTFPYENLAKYKRIWETGVGPDEDPIMPLEKLDFMGAGEKLPDGVKRHICGILEESGGYAGWATGHSLQSPLTSLRFSLLFHTSMAMMRGQIDPYRKEAHECLPTRQKFSKYYGLMESILGGTAANLGVAYRSAFRLEEEMDEILGHSEEYDNEFGLLDLETSLIELLGTALGTWSVGETREDEFTYTPFAWLEQEEDSHAENNDDEFC